MDQRAGTLSLLIYPDGDSSFDLYEDDGTSRAPAWWHDGERFLWLSFTQAQAQLDIAIAV